MQVARGLLGCRVRSLQIPARATGTAAQIRWSQLLLHVSAATQWRVGLYRSSSAWSQSSNTSTTETDVFSEKYTPVFGSHLGRCLDRPAVHDDAGSYTYAEVYRLAGAIRDQIVNKGGIQPTRTSDGPCTNDIDEGRVVPRVAYLCPGDVRYVATLWAIWKCGLSAVPLFHEHPISVMEYYVIDSQASLLVSTREFELKLKELGSKTNTPVIILDETDEIGSGPSWSDTPKWCELETYDALMMYTSGTTGPPKGVVLRHANLRFQTSQIRDAWQWSERDRILHALPLHHTHGIVSGILTPLYSGACVRMLPKFDPNRIWQHLLLETEPEYPVSIFMGVPTMYIKLLSYFENHLAANWPLEEVHKAIRTHIRFLISGSAPLPEPVYKRIEATMGLEVIERYGMTEVGIPLSNALHGKRYAGELRGLPNKKHRSSNRSIGGPPYC
ncbi:acyl-CoA synthetase family member 3 [Tropilaelaps mercedesae]|uniref:Acyl-CoA synthetase family member 3 n=1 Tax=Tropilaelaps mercedesae TaxID=418985 RepID=A0A1V9XNG9_9ACAR|nr:acyl-CoA synthetase family member 3 [Tropilaelaps mercedesae]